MAAFFGSSGRIDGQANVERAVQSERDAGRVEDRRFGRMGRGRECPTLHYGERAGHPENHYADYPDFAVPPAFGGRPSGRSENLGNGAIGHQLNKGIHLFPFAGQSGEENDSHPESGNDPENLEERENRILHRSLSAPMALGTNFVN